MSLKSLLALRPPAQHCINVGSTYIRRHHPTRLEQQSMVTSPMANPTAGRSVRRAWPPGCCSAPARDGAQFALPVKRLKHKTRVSRPAAHDSRSTSTNRASPWPPNPSSSRRHSVRRNVSFSTTACAFPSVPGSLSSVSEAMTASSPSKPFICRNPSTFSFNAGSAAQTGRHRS